MEKAILVRNFGRTDILSQLIDSGCSLDSLDQPVSRATLIE